MKALIMSSTPIRRAVKFGNIYQKALQSQLQLIGSNLATFRKAWNEDISTVSDVVDLAPGVLEQVESGNCDFQLKTLFALCEYYDTELESVVGKGELMSIRIN